MVLLVCCCASMVVRDMGETASPTCEGRRPRLTPGGTETEGPSCMVVATGPVTESREESEEEEEEGGMPYGGGRPAEGVVAGGWVRGEGCLPVRSYAALPRGMDMEEEEEPRRRFCVCIYICVCGVTVRESVNEWERNMCVRNSNLWTRNSDVCVGVCVCDRERCVCDR